MATARHRDRRIIGSARGWRTSVLALSVSLGGAGWLAGATAFAQPAAQARHSFDIGAGPLGPRLNELARAAGVVLSFDAALADSKSTAGVRGVHDVPSAFAALLAGSGLEAVEVAQGRYTLRPAPASGPPAVPAAPAPLRIAQPARREAALPDVTVRSAAAGSEYREKHPSVGVLGELPLMQTPFSVNSFTRDFIENRQAGYLGDLLKSDPSIIRANTSTPTFSSMRGFNLGTDSLLYDGMALGTGFSASRMQLEAVERIDLLKGPSGFLNGLAASGSVGGAINLIPKRPLDTAVNSWTASHQSRSIWGIHGDLGNRFGDGRQFGYRLNVGFKDGEERLEGAQWRHQMVTLAGDWRATPDLLLTAAVDHWYNSNPRSQLFNLAAGVDLPAVPEATRNYSQTWTRFEQHNTQASLRADWKFAPAWSMTAQYLKGRSERLFTNGGTIVIASNAGALTYSSSASAADYDYEAGRWLIDGELTTGPVRHRLSTGITVSAYENTSRTTAGRTFASSLNAPVYTPEPADVFTTYLTPPRLQNKTRSTGLFISDLISFDERWSVLLGLRHAVLDYTNLNIATGAVVQDSRKSKNSPTVALMYRPAGDLLLYASHAQGLERGGLAPAGRTNAGAVMPPLETSQLEAGARWELKDLTLSVAAFRIGKALEYNDVASNTYVQDGRQVHTGLEFIANGRMTRNLSIMGGVMLLDPKSERTGSAGTDGKQPPGVSRVNISLYGEYRLAGMPGLYLTGGAYHSGAQYVNATNTVAIPSWTHFDIGARYVTRLAGRPVTFLAMLENATDRRYWSSALSSSLTIGEPRTLRVSARIDL